MWSRYIGIMVFRFTNVSKLSKSYTGVLPEVSAAAEKS